MEKISFIILSWNSDKYLKNCIESIETFKNFEIEIIIIDNGSKDKSVEITKKYKQVKLITLDKNYGTTISRNKGLHLIKDADFICILDSDTIVNEDAFFKMANYLRKNQDVGIVGPSMLNGDNERQASYRKFPTWKIKLLKACPIASISKKGAELEKYDISKLPNEFECDYLISACWLMRKEIYDKCGDLDEKIFYAPEDVEYCMRVRSFNFKIVHIQDAEIIHYYQRISKKKLISKANITHILGINYVLKKYKRFLKEYKKS